MKKYFYILTLFILFSDFANAQCTKIGTFIGTFNQSFLSYVDAENPQVLRAMLSEKQVSYLVNNSTALNDFDAFLDSLSNRNIELILTIRFVYSVSLHKEDRIITDSVELDSIMNNIQNLLNVANNRIPYLQVLNETFGVGKYNTTIDSLTFLYGNSIAAEDTVLSWIDTIASRFRNLIISNNYSIDLLSPSVQSKGIEAVKNNQTSAWTYKLTTKIFEVTNLYCDALNFHWYPESYTAMQELVEFVDTSSVLQISPTIDKTCTEWSQAHEVRNILQSDMTFWTNALQLHCGTSDTNLTQGYLALINDSLGINHNHTYDMYQLMNQYNYKFASYFAMVQDHYTCGEMSSVWYALCDLYATRFTANKVPNGNFYDQYQNIRQYIYTNCTTGIMNEDVEIGNEFLIYPNPTNGSLSLSLPQIKNNTELYIYNAIGQKVYSQYYQANATGTKININLDLPSGIYFVALKNKKIISVQKFIMMK